MKKDLLFILFVLLSLQGISQQSKPPQPSCDDLKKEYNEAGEVTYSSPHSIAGFSISFSKYFAKNFTDISASISITSATQEIDPRGILLEFDDGTILFAKSTSRTSCNYMPEGRYYLFIGIMTLDGEAILKFHKNNLVKATIGNRYKNVYLEESERARFYLSCILSQRKS